MKTMAKDAGVAIGDGILTSAGAPHELDSHDESLAQTTAARVDEQLMESGIRAQPFREDDSGSIERTQQRKSKERITTQGSATGKSNGRR